MRRPSARGWPCSLASPLAGVPPPRRGLALEFHTAPPDSVATNREGDSEGGVHARATLFHAKKVTTQLILPDGGTRLIASWTPTGKPEFGQFGHGETRTLVFLAANIQRK